MAIIYSYPGKSPVTANDTVVITDSSGGVSPANATKSATMSTIADYVINSSGYPITLQRVLNDGSTATSQSQAWNGRLKLDPGSGIPAGDPIQFLVEGYPAIGANTLKFEYNTDSALTSQLQVVGGVEFKTTTSGVGEKLFTFNKSTGDVSIEGRFEVGDTAVFLSSVDINNILTLYDDLDFDGTGSINLDTGNIDKSGAGFLDITSNDGIRLKANNGTNPTINMFPGGGVDIISEGSGTILISPENGGTGDIEIGNGASGGEVTIQTSNNLDIDAVTGIAIDNFTSGNIDITNSSSTGTLNLQAFNDVRVTSTGHDIVITTNNPAKDININAGNNLDLNAKAPGIYVNVIKASAGTIDEGRAVYIVSQSGGYIEVEECDADDPSKMPAFGVVTEPVTTSEGKVITNGVHTFSSGSVIVPPPAVANSPIYVAGATSDGGATTPGTLIVTRPTSRYAPLATSTYPDLQVVGRIIDPSSPDRIFINCVGFQAPEIIRGQFDVELWDGTGGGATQIAQNTLAKGYYEINNSIVSGFFKIDTAIGATTTLASILYVKFRLPGSPAAYLHDNNNYPPNSNLVGTALCVTSNTTDPQANANVGSISSINGYSLKRLVPGAGYEIIQGGSPSVTITQGDNFEFSFSYYTDK